MTEEIKTGAAEIPQDAKTWALLTHISALIGFIIPFGNLIAPLILWQIKKNEFEFVDDQGKEAVNFQISILIYLVVSAILIIIVIGILLMIAIGIFALVMTVIAAINANNGVRYRYPLTLRLIK